MNSPSTPVVVITGGTGGIGQQGAIGIARSGARVLVTGRNRERGAEAVRAIVEASGSDQVELVVGDVSSIAGVDALAAAIAERTDRIDVLVNNAGYLGSTPGSSDDGIELHFAVNVLAPWRLTRALVPQLEAAVRARVVNVTGGDKPAAIDPDNLQAEQGFRGLNTYTHSKSVLEAMSVDLARELEPRGIGVNVVFPGRASTNMTRSMGASALPGLLKLMLPFFRLLFAEDGGKSAAKAARSTIWAATTSDIDGVGGRYYDTNCVEQKMHPTAYQPAVHARIRAVIASAGPDLPV